MEEPTPVDPMDAIYAQIATEMDRLTFDLITNGGAVVVVGLSLALVWWGTPRLVDLLRMIGK